METHYTFLTDRFAPTAAELDEQHADYINPGLFAMELADYMENLLMKQGYKVRFRTPEDWGHWLEIEHEGKYTLAVCCANAEQTKGDKSYHRVFTTPDKPVIRRWFRKIDVREDVEKLAAAIKKILVDDDRISEIEPAETSMA